MERGGGKFDLVIDDGVRLKNFLMRENKKTGKNLFFPATKRRNIAGLGSNILSSFFILLLGEGVPMKSGRMRLINTLQRNILLYLIIIKSFRPHLFDILRSNADSLYRNDLIKIDIFKPNRFKTFDELWSNTL